MIEVFPIMEVLQSMLMGTGDCAEIQWQWLGLSIPGWSILAFAGLAVAHLTLVVRKK
jgi:disulfide bond formation protein DsbB